MITRIATAQMAVVILSMGLAVAMPPSYQASANGASYFADPDRPDDGTLYFGLIKDQKGIPIVGANVQIRVKGQNVEYVYHTTTLGRYRSVDLPKDTDPKLVEVVVEKSGFRVVSQDNRTRTIRAGLPVEINFVLAPASTG